VWAYFRDSGGQEQERSVAQQQREAEAYCGRNGLCLDRLFADEARPGGTVIGREAFDEMIAACRQLAPEAKRRDAGAPDGILLWDLKRFARNQLDSQFFKADLRRRGYTIIFLSDSIPLGDAGIVYEAMLEWKAQQDLADISKDARRGLADLVATRGPDGRYLGLCPGRPPTGFKGEPYQLGLKRDGTQRVVQRWTPDPEIWTVVKRAWELRAKGKSYAEVHAETRLFKTVNCYPTFFRNRIYTGTLVYGGQELRGFAPALVDEETWQKVQALVTPRRLRRPRQATSDYTLSGLAFCGVCGGALAGNGIAPRADAGDGYGRRRYRRYTCTRWKNAKRCSVHHVPADRLEQAVYRTLAEQVLRPERLAEMLADARPGEDERADLEKRAGRLEGQVAEMDRVISRLLDSLERSGHSVSIAGRLVEREHERSALAAELQGARRRLEQANVDIPAAALERFCADMQAVLGGEEVQDIRALLRMLIVRVDVYDDHSGRVLYHFPWVEWIQ